LADAQKKLSFDVKSRLKRKPVAPATLLKVLDQLFDAPDKRSFPVIEATLMRLGGWTDLHPLMVFNYLCTLMNTIVVNFIRSQGTPPPDTSFGSGAGRGGGGGGRGGRDPLPSAAIGAIPAGGASADTERSREVLTSYLALHHMLVAFARRYPDIPRFCSFRVQQFKTDPESRRKHTVHDLGEFVLCLLLSDLTWYDVAIAMLLELFDRNVLWTLRQYPELENVGKYTGQHAHRRNALWNELPFCAVFGGTPRHPLCRPQQRRSRFAVLSPA
jgi:hypothetical protein